MLTISIRADGVTDIRRFALPNMVQLAKLTLQIVELDHQGHLYKAYPTDTIESLQAAFDRLFPHSRIIDTRQKKPTPRY